MIINLIFLKFTLFISVVILSLWIVIISNRGLLGIRLQKILGVSTIGEYILSITMVVGVIMFILNIGLVFINYYLSINPQSIEICSIIDNNTTASDPVRFWPSGTAQTWGIIGTAAALYKATPGGSRIKTTAALGSLAITIPLNVYLHAVENPNGFNRLMYSWVEYKNTGNWPGNIPTNVGDEIIDKVLIKNGEEANSTLNSIQNSSNFLPSNINDLLSSFSPENLFYNFIGLFKPVGVEGYLDDLIGQQLVIYFLLILVVIGLLLLFTLYFLIQTMYNNKEFITKRFNNRFIKLYLKYQLFLTNISLFVLPAFIFVGILELFVGLYFLITHPIPYENLPIDLHIYLKK